MRGLLTLNLVHSSWGQYWAEMGFMRLEAGKNLLGIEGEVAWASKFLNTDKSIRYGSQLNCNLAFLYAVQPRVSSPFITFPVPKMAKTAITRKLLTRPTILILPKTWKQFNVV